jgi:hypothetical protein
MNRDEAQRSAAELNREHPDRGKFRWIAREGEDGWQVARIKLPGALRLDPLKQGVEAKPKPPDAPDPRPAFFRDVGGPYAGG